MSKSHNAVKQPLLSPKEKKAAKQAKKSGTPVMPLAAR